MTGRKCVRTTARAKPVQSRVATRVKAESRARRAVAAPVTDRVSQRVAAKQALPRSAKAELVAAAGASGVAGGGGEAGAVDPGPRECPTGTADCDDDHTDCETNTASDAQNCGRCDRACG